MNLLFKHQRKILAIAAILNFIGAVIAIISPAFFLQQFFKYKPDLTATFPFLAMYHYLFWGFVFIMGIAYWMTAVDPAKNKIIMLVGALGKLLAVAFWIMLYIQGQGAWLMLGASISDGIFGIIFVILFLKNLDAEKT